MRNKLHTHYGAIQEVPFRVPFTSAIQDTHQIKSVRSHFSQDQVKLNQNLVRIPAYGRERSEDYHLMGFGGLVDFICVHMDQPAVTAEIPRHPQLIKYPEKSSGSWSSDVHYEQASASDAVMTACGFAGPSVARNWQYSILNDAMVACMTSDPQVDARKVHWYADTWTHLA